ncbi:hypothetical protein D3C73_1087140 [compost metagenome]
MIVDACGHEKKPQGARHAQLLRARGNARSLARAGPVMPCLGIRQRARRLSQPPHFAGGAVRGRRADRCGRAQPGRVHGQDAGAKCRDRKPHRRGRHAGVTARGARRARRLYLPDPPQRHGDRAGALPQAVVQPADRLRLRRPGGGRAHDLAGPQRLAGRRHDGLYQVRARKRQQDQPGQRRAGCGIAVVRHAAAGSAGRAVHHGALCRHGARHDGAAGRPGGCAVRPDHADHSADQSRPREAIRRHHAGPHQDTA